MTDEQPRTLALSVIIITHEEAARLPTCLASVAFADEIVVLDSCSQDATVKIAEAAGARVILTPDWPGFGIQKQKALEAARGRWVLSLDADEWLDDDLAAAIRAVVQSPSRPDDAAGFEVDRLSAFCGQWMRAGSWYPDWTLRLVRRDRARFSPDRVHERLSVDGPVGRLQGRLLHNSIATLHDALNKMNRYTSGRAADLHARGKRGGLARALAHAAWAFARSYLLRRGFRDGRLGFVLALLDAHSTYYRYLKLWLADRSVPHALPPPGSR